MCYMHVDVGPKNNCLKWLQLSHPVMSTFISLVRKTPWFGCTHSTDTNCLPGEEAYLHDHLVWTRDWTQSFASHGLCQPPFQHAPGEKLQQQLKWKALCGLAICTMALQMYAIGNVTVVVWHLYLFGYVLVVYVCDKCGKFRRYYLY